jgi:hypothetical protein
MVSKIATIQSYRISGPWKLEDHQFIKHIELLELKLSIISPKTYFKAIGRAILQSD